MTTSELDSNDGTGLTTSDGSLDVKGRPAIKSRTGGWKGCAFIYAYEIAERMAYYGLSANLVTYLTEELHQSLATSSQHVNHWNGAVYFCSILGAFVADASMGRYATTIIFLLLYLAGFILLTLSASVEGLKPTPCPNPTSHPCSKPASTPQLAFFFVALYMVAVGAGGMKPNTSSLGADQFDEEDPQEAVQKITFFNWWYMGVALGILFSVTALVYIQDNVGWSWGFGTPTAILSLSIAIFLCGSKYYRHQPPRGSPFTQVVHVVAASIAKSRLRLPSDPALLHEVPHRKHSTPGRRQMLHTTSFTFLDKAAAWKLCTVTEVEEVKLFLGMVPIWTTQLLFQTVIGQSLTLFTKQASAMDRRLGPHFTLPPASCGAVTAIAILLSCGCYHRLLVPAARAITGNPRGISSLQRIGAGMLIAIACICTAAATETRRRRSVVAPLSVYWLLPQYLLVGAADAVGVVGQLEFFYDQAPDHMRSLGTALYLTTTGAGMFLSSALISLTNRLTGRGGHHPWLGSHIHSSRLDNFFWLLASLSAANFCCFLLLASRYKYKKTESSLHL